MKLPEDIRGLAQEILDLHDKHPREFKILVALYSRTLRCAPVNVHGFIDYCRQEVVYPNGEIYKASEE